MADSKLDIWNAARDRIGENDAIEDENDSGTSAQVCDRHYDRCRKEVLKTLRWPFATAQETLSELAAVTVVGWENAYALPADCLEPRGLLPEGMTADQIPPDLRIPFEIMARRVRVDDGGGASHVEVTQMLVTNATQGDQFDALEYTLDIEDTSLFDPLFETALAWRLAAELQLSVKKSRSEYDRIMDERAGDYWKALRLAAASAFRGTQGAPPPETPSLAARGSAGYVRPGSR